MSEQKKPSDSIMFNISTDPSIPRGYQAEPMDYIRAIMKFLDEVYAERHEEK